MIESLNPDDYEYSELVVYTCSQIIFPIYHYLHCTPGAYDTKIDVNCH